MARSRPRLSADARGLGSDHRAKRRTALTALRDGDPCARCQQRGIYHPMYRALVTWSGGRPTSRWLDLDDFPGRAIGGPQVKRLSYRKCNRSAGATLGNQMRGRQRHPQQARMAKGRREW